MPAFFSEVEADTTQWLNFWLDTDSIATPLFSADGLSGNTADRADNKIPDPLHDIVHSHSNYWTAQQQSTAIEQYFAPKSPGPGLWASAGPVNDPATP